MCLLWEHKKQLLEHFVRGMFLGFQFFFPKQIYAGRCWCDHKLPTTMSIQDILQEGKVIALTFTLNMLSSYINATLLKISQILL